MEKLLKENIIFLVIIIGVIAGGIAADYAEIAKAISSKTEMDAKKMEVETKQAKVNQLKQTREIAETAPKKKEAKSGKVIYEVLGQQFSPEASFGIMFENILANITNSGVRIRSIDYNYQPIEDKVLLTNVAGYYACELSFTTVGTYAQLQNFFRSIAKETYLTSLYEVYIEPYERDKTILIAKFKVRLYTKII